MYFCVSYALEFTEHFVFRWGTELALRQSDSSVLAQLPTANCLVDIICFIIGFMACAPTVMALSVGNPLCASVRPLNCVRAEVGCERKWLLARLIA